MMNIRRALGSITKPAREQAEQVVALPNLVCLLSFYIQLQHIRSTHSQEHTELEENQLNECCCAYC